MFFPVGVWGRGKRPGGHSQRRGGVGKAQVTPRDPLYGTSSESEIPKGSCSRLEAWWVCSRWALPLIRKALSKNAPSDLEGAREGVRGRGEHRVTSRSTKPFLAAGSEESSKRFPDAEQRAAVMSSYGKCDLPTVSKVLAGEEEWFYEPGTKTPGVANSVISERVIAEDEY